MPVYPPFSVSIGTAVSSSDRPPRVFVVCRRSGVETKGRDMCYRSRGSVNRPTVGRSAGDVLTDVVDVLADLAGLLVGGIVVIFGAAHVADERIATGGRRVVERFGRVADDIERVLNRIVSARGHVFDAIHDGV